MTDLRTAAQQALEALETPIHEQSFMQKQNAITNLRAALAEPVQRPVAWRFKAMIGMPWSLSDDGYYISCKRDQRYFVEALYTAPPQRKPLTEEEIAELARQEQFLLVCDGLDELTEIARAIERAHGITT